MNTINIVQHLAGIPAFSYRRIVGIAALHILNAGIIANDSREAAAEARRIYSRNRGGLWRRVQSDARKILSACDKHGLTFERPYLIRDGMIWIACEDGDGLAPIRWHVPSISASGI